MRCREGDEGDWEECGAGYILMVDHSLPYSDRGQGHWHQASESKCNHYWKAAKSK